MSTGRFLRPWTLALLTAGLLAAECLLFHFNWITIVHVADLFGVMVLVGRAVAQILTVKFDFEKEPDQLLSLSLAIGFCVAIVLARVGLHLDFFGTVWLLLIPLFEIEGRWWRK